MDSFLVMLAPSVNRVYADAAPRLAAAELHHLTKALVPGGVDVEPMQVMGVDYLQVTVPQASSTLNKVLSNASATMGIFERVGDLLRPVAVEPFDCYPSDLVTIQKYQGKTNEQWSRLMLNVTAAYTARPQLWLERSLEVLDPMCGRGTTLNLALLGGLSATGVEVDSQDYQAYSAFIKTWARTHRLKHDIQTKALRTAGRTRGAQLDLQIAANKEAHRASDVQRIRYLNTDTTDLEGVLRKGSIDVIVTDTPYGVRHGSRGDRLDRRPLELLDRALPGWLRALRTGGAIGLSYNRHVAEPAALATLLADHGLEVVELKEEFRHRVDASIDRDLMVARRVGSN